ncbi:hypothetical protein ACFWOT_03160 [Streptomyces sp. NPDC058440]|uniref:hypothetical protein n=1 Tax=Streptomyces sp. NPDC058440 TaxID=3346501 RepID=UPI003650B9C7
MPFADDLINRTTAQTLIRAIRQSNTGAELPALRRVTAGLSRHAPQFAVDTATVWLHRPRSQ